MVLDCLSNNVCELLEKYFEEMDQKYAAQSNHISVQLGTVRYLHLRMALKRNAYLGNIFVT